MQQTGALLFIAPTNELRAGAEISHFELIKAAKKRGYKVHVVVPAEGSFGEELQRAHIEYTAVQYSWWGGPLFTDNDGKVNLLAVDTICQLIKQHKTDCVITNTLNVPWGALAAAMADVTHVWIARELPLYEFSYLSNRYDFIDGFSNLIIANSKTVAGYMQSKRGIKRTKQFYSFVDTGALHLNKAIKRPKIVSVGQIQPAKNQLELIKAADLLRRRGLLDAEILLVGGYTKNDEYFKKIQDFINKSSLQKLVKFTGYRQNPYKLIGLNDIFVHTSLSESFSRAIGEAMKLGLICVGTDIPGNKEAFKLGSGSLYKTQDHEDLARVLAMILKDVPAFKRRAQNAQQKALNNLSESACHNPFFLELKKVFGQPNPRSELRHLLVHLRSASQEFQNYDQRISVFQQSIKEYDRHLSNIVNSRSWKLVLRARKLLRR